MIKKILITLLTMTVMHTTLLFSQTVNNTISCAPELKNSLQTIQKLNEGKQLIADILKEGPIRISVANSRVPEQFGACWDPVERIIFVSISSPRNQGEVIGSIIFELHNALNTAKFDDLDYLASVGKIDKRTYVREVEHAEYKNSHAASKLANLGIQKGIFPKSARLFVYPNFEEHFYWQKFGGHSAVIARNYDSMTPATYYACYPRKYRRAN